MSDAWIDTHLIQQESRSIAGWRARAIGMPVKRALEYIPRRGLLQTWVPIEAFRDLQAHIRTTRLTQAAWLRRAVINTYLAEGGSPLVAHALNQIAGK